jgi:hypothetical protein
MSQIDVWHHSGRRNPATDVLISRDRPTIEARTFPISLARRSVGEAGHSFGIRHSDFVIAMPSVPAVPKSGGCRTKTGGLN